MEKIGRYVIERELGQGGTAIVYLGQDPAMKRQVVIKLLRRQHTTEPEFLARFQREAEVVAALEHPYIVPVYDAGEHDSQPYLVMRYLPGGSLRDRLEYEHYLPVAEIMSVIERVAEALDEAHAHAIVHRDLKPANILFDQRGQAFLSDFGIAKMTHPSSGITQSGIVVGTPEYMSPEQALGAIEVDARSDVYSLGVILFQMLAGQLPFRAETPMGVALAHINAPIPSAVALRPDLASAWDTIVQHVLEKQPDQRYQSAGELARAVRQVTAAQGAGLSPVPPKPATGTHPLPRVQAGTHPLPRAQAGTQPLSPAWTPLPFETRGRLGLAAKTAAIPRAWLKADAARPLLSTQAAPGAAPLARWGKGRVRAVAMSSNGQVIAVATALGVYLYGAEKLDELVFIDFAASVTSVAFSPDGHRLACGGGDHLVRLWDLDSGQLLFIYKGHEDDVISLAFSPTGDRLASGSTDATLRIWNTLTGQCQGILQGHRLAVSSVVFSPDGRHLASGSTDCALLYWDAADGQLLNNLPLLTASPTQAAFTPQGHPLALGSFDNAIRLWDGLSGEMLQVFEPLPANLTGVSLSRDLHWLASGSDDGRVRLWKVSSGELAQTLEGHSGEVQSLVFNPADETHGLLSGGSDGAVRLWNTAATQRSRALEGFVSEMTCLVCLAPEGAALLGVGSQDNTIRLLDLNTGRVVRTLAGHTAPPTCLAWCNPDGKRLVLVSGGQDKTVRLWDSGTGQQVGALRQIQRPVRSLAFSPDGRVAAVGDESPVFGLWDVHTGLRRQELKGHTQAVTSLAYSADGRWLASGSEDNTARVWDARTGKQRLVLEGHSITVTSVAFSPDSQLLASGSEDSTVRVYDLRTGKVVRKLEGHISYVSSIAFNPAAGSRLLASCGSDRTVRLWDAQAGKILRTLEGHTGGVNSVAFTLDGRLLVSGANDGAVIIWGVPT